MNPDTKAEHHRRDPTDGADDDPRQAIESGEPTIEGRQPGRPDDAERDVEGAGPDQDHRRGNVGEQGQDWESGRQQSV